MSWLCDGLFFAKRGSNKLGHFAQGKNFKLEARQRLMTYKKHALNIALAAVYSLPSILVRV